MMNKKEIIIAYETAKRRMLKNSGNVKIPRLFNHDGSSYTVTGLSFVFFVINLRKIIAKIDLLMFLRAHGCCHTTMPHPRHFGMQNGMYFLVQGCFHPIKKRVLLPGEYCLYSIARNHPDNLHAVDRRRALSSSVFDKLKLKSFGRCMVCGSLEHEKNLKNSALVTKLEMGHCDPDKPLSASNCIPMCQYCNHVYKNKWVFNRRGIIISKIKK